MLLGFEIDPLNDSMTEQEREVRKKRAELEEEFKPGNEDSFYKRIEREKMEEEALKNKEYLLQFLQVSDKDILNLPTAHMA